MSVKKTNSFNDSLAKNPKTLSVDNVVTEKPSLPFRLKTHKKAPSDSSGTGSSVSLPKPTRLLSSPFGGRTKVSSPAKNNEKSEGSYSSQEEPKKLVVVVNEAINMFDIESDHFIEVWTDASPTVHTTKMLSGTNLKWNKKFQFHFIVSEDIKVRFAIKTSSGEKATGEILFNQVFVGKSEKSKKQLSTPNGVNYCTLYYELALEEESKAKDKEFRRFSQGFSQGRSTSHENLSLSEGDQSATGSSTSPIPKSSPIKKAYSHFRASSSGLSPNDSNELRGSQGVYQSGFSTAGPTVQFCEEPKVIPILQVCDVNDSPRSSNTTTTRATTPTTTTPTSSAVDASFTTENHNITASDISSKIISSREPENDSLFSPSSAIVNFKVADYVYKVIIVGDSGVGKSCLMKRWVFEEFQNSTSTICLETQVKSYTVNDEIVSFQVWDTAGQEKFRAMTNSYYRGAHGVIMVYDVTYAKSFDSIKRWLDDVESNSSLEAPPKILLVGNKTDNSSRSVPSHLGRTLAQNHNLFFMETSALTGDNVNCAIQILMQEIHKNKDLYQKALTGGGSNQSGNIFKKPSNVVLKQPKNNIIEVKSTEPVEEDTFTECCGS